MNHRLKLAPALTAVAVAGLALVACGRSQEDKTDPAEATGTEAAPTLAEQAAGVPLEADAPALEPAVPAPNNAPRPRSRPGRSTPPPVNIPNDNGAIAPERPRGPRPSSLSDMHERSDQIFDRFDADGDQVIGAAERQSVADGRGLRRLERADANGDGRVTRAEMRSATETMFRRMDANGDGVISTDERPDRGDRED
ncbi:hypothetical protein [Brevundimonas sp.]|uniref:EF-hand domain-containing protein n=1 Tax=Brevundimonas sp. TaxID=1871086 RepID=UPI002AB93206|nr:hypothetical protein [Brevundimonas sp.]MDZ4364085.1 hypothetical protein [Brevundimonas sp.]